MAIFTPIFQSLQPEDLVLFVWLGFIEPLLYGVMTNLFGSIQPWDLGGPNLLLGLIFVGAGIGGLIVVLTRAPGSADNMLDTGGVSGFVHLPMLMTLGYIFLYGLTALNAFTDSMIVGVPCLLFGALAVGYMFFKRLPVLPTLYRRLLIAPIVLIGTWNFSALVNSFFGNVTASNLLTPDALRQLTDASSSAGFVLGLVTASLVLFYLVFIVAPRQIAYPSGSWRDWIVRFGIFAIALVFNLGWARFV